MKDKYVGLNSLKVIIDTSLFIVQHPNAHPLKLSFDTEAIIGINKNGTTVKYKTNTEPGSSGSPSFDINLNLVALHHSGGPTETQLTTQEPGG